MTSQEKKDLIQYINQSTNANTMFVSFDRGSQKDFVLQDFLLKQLKSGMFHYAMQKADLELGYEWYMERIIDHWFWGQLTIVHKPWNTRNGNEDLLIEKISEAEALTILLDIMHNKKSARWKNININDATDAIKSFLSYNQSESKCFYRVEPNFLYTCDDMVASGYTVLWYFEDQWNNLVLAIQTDESVDILLINGY